MLVLVIHQIKTSSIWTTTQHCSPGYQPAALPSAQKGYGANPGQRFQVQEDKKVTENSQVGYSKGKSHLTNMTLPSGMKMALWLRGEKGDILTPSAPFKQKCLKNWMVKVGGKLTSGLKDHNQQLQPPLGCWLLMASLKDQPALLRNRDRMRDNGKEDPSWNKRKSN